MPTWPNAWMDQYYYSPQYRPPEKPAPLINPIRERALELALERFESDQEFPTTPVLEVAKQFEKYLRTGEVD